MFPMLPLSTLFKLCIVLWFPDPLFTLSSIENNKRWGEPTSPPTGSLWLTNWKLWRRWWRRTGSVTGIWRRRCIPADEWRQQIPGDARFRPACQRGACAKSAGSGSLWNTEYLHHSNVYCWHAEERQGVCGYLHFAHTEPLKSKALDEFQDAVYRGTRLPTQINVSQFAKQSNVILKKCSI